MLSEALVVRGELCAIRVERLLFPLLPLRHEQDEVVIRISEHVSSGSPFLEGGVLIAEGIGVDHLPPSSSNRGVSEVL